MALAWVLALGLGISSSGSRVFGPAEAQAALQQGIATAEREQQERLDAWAVQLLAAAIEEQVQQEKSRQAFLTITPPVRWIYVQPPIRQSIMYSNGPSCVGGR